jgi:hypothetical protein
MSDDGSLHSTEGDDSTELEPPEHEEILRENEGENGADGDDGRRLFW